MATTAVIPTYVVDGSLAVTAALLPSFTVGELTLAALKIPPYTLGSYRTVGFIPPFVISPLTFALTATGGIIAGGGAQIVGDAYKPTGGSVIGGAATTADVSVLYSQIYPRGGIVLAGGATIIVNLRGGTVLGGVANVNFVTAAIYAITPATNGTIMGGAATIGDRTPYAPNGGMFAAGTVGVAINYAFNSSGGALMSGQAIAAAVLSAVVSGGSAIGGSAVIRDNYPLYIPSGGSAIGGVALNFFVPAGGVTTPENPYNNPFECWAVNYETAAASRYARLPANSICRFKGVTYVANAGGIYALDADSDAGIPIAASITLGTTDYGTQFNKRIQYVYLGFKSNLPMTLTTITNTTTKTYSDVQPAGGGNRGSRAILGRGLNGLYWSFKLENKNGAYFELDNFRLETTISDRMGV